MNLSSNQTTTIVALIRQVADILESANGATLPSAVVTEKGKKAIEKIIDTAKEVVEETGSDVEVTEEELKAMSFNKLKAFAKAEGITATGTKAQILERILNSDGDGEVETPTEEKPVEKAKVVKAITKVKDEEETEPTLADRVAEEMKDSTDAELKQILLDVGIKAIGKRQSYLDKIVKAIEDKLLDFGEEETETEPVADEVPVEEPGEEQVGSPERLDAMESLYEDLSSKYKAKEITDKEIEAFLKGFYDGKAPKATKAEKLEDYLSIQINLIDDEGNQHDLEDPYYVAEAVWCCGEETKTLENGHASCEVCGQEFEV